ncbi:hypothetical protein A5651_09225 [Mycobacterium sp. 1274761.0]|nr:hypothetical protein A5651_09225 [Mycobacterium sp. 1274761.0]
MPLPKDGYIELERGRYGPVFPSTPACQGFSIIATIIKFVRDHQVPSFLEYGEHPYVPPTK